ncbi:MAG: adenylate/guanylate cyclase domain-containing protein [Dehalococcoidia bacterium]
MALTDEIQQRVQSIFQSRWTIRPGRVVPEPEDVGLRNDAVAFDSATVLYADLAGSTRLVDAESRELAAEVYKSYLYAAARIVNAEGGNVTAYDGDRIMALFLGSSKNTSAARCALKINCAVTQILNPALAQQYPASSYRIQQVVGIDTSPIMAARTGARGDNDLVWVGRAANYAAKLTELPPDCSSWITGDVYDGLHADLKLGGNPKRPMWEERVWTAMGGVRIFRSNWWWRLD